MFVRLSLSKPRTESREEAKSIEDHLVSHYAVMPGFVRGYRLENSEYVGRVTIWKNRQVADQAASDEDTMASRSRLIQLQLAPERDTLVFSFEGVQP